MNRPSDPILNELAHAAEDIQMNIPFEGIDEHLRVIRKGGTRLPKHVRQFPNTKQRAMAGLYVGGKFRILAYCPTVEMAARFADILVVVFDEYRKHGVKTDPKSAAAELNFPLEAALQDLQSCEPLQAWVGNLMSHLLHTGMLKEKGFKSSSRLGRPQNSETIASLRADIGKLGLKLDDLLKRVEVLIDRTPATVIIGPSNPTTPQLRDAIGWPVPAAPGDYPFTTWGMNEPKATS